MIFPDNTVQTTGIDLGQIRLSPASNYSLNFGAGSTSSYAPPNITNYLGERLVLWNNNSNTGTWHYAIGIDAGTMWFGLDSVSGGSGHFKWYGRDTEIMDLNDSGVLGLKQNNAGPEYLLTLTGNGGDKIKFTVADTAGYNELVSINKFENAYSNFAITAAGISFNTDNGNQSFNFDSLGNLSLSSLKFTNTTTQFSITTPPLTSKGKLGDLSGCLAVDSLYMYYCIDDYTTGTNDIWVRMAWTETSW